MNDKAFSQTHENDHNADGGKMDTIYRQAAIDALKQQAETMSEWSNRYAEQRKGVLTAVNIVEDLPSAQPTLNGYSVEHLVFISKLLAKENLPPERVSDALYDIGRIIALVRKESEEAMRKAVEQCMI